MATTQTSKENAMQVASAETVDTKLEVITIPVSDIDRAKRFYEGLGWRLDADFSGDGWRAVQLTPPGSPCSIHLGTTAVPGSAQGLFLVVDDIEAARADLIRKGVDVSEPFHYAGIRGPRLPGPDPERRLLSALRLIQRSGRQRLAAAGDQDAASRTRTQPGRREADRASARNRETPWRVRADRSEAPLVGLVRRLRGCARAREDSRRGGQGCHAPHRRRSRRAQA